MFHVLGAAVALSLLSSPVLHTDGPHIKDADGRVVVLRGVNVAGNAKLPPFAVIDDDALLDPLPGWGFNVIRLVFTWEAFESERGQYNMDYLRYIEHVIRAAHDRGVATVVDFHQDALTRTMIDGCGEGFPLWVIPENVRQHAPRNDGSCALWGLKLFTNKELPKGWAAFFHDVNGVRESYVAMVSKVATTLRHTPGLIGYDLLNEPMGDEKTDIAGFFEEVGAAVASIDPDALLFVEPHFVSGLGRRSALPKPSFGNVVFAPHYYDATTMALRTYLGYSLKAPLERLRQTAEEWNVPFLLGEFGMYAPVVNAQGYIRHIYDHLDDHFSSSTQWAYTPGWTRKHKDGWNHEDFSIVDDRNGLRHNFQPRPYAQVTAGKPVHLKVLDGGKPQRRGFEVAWEHEPALGSTVIYVPPEPYFGDSAAMVTSGVDLQCTRQDFTLVCQSETAGIKSVQVGAL